MDAQVDRRPTNLARVIAGVMAVGLTAIGTFGCRGDSESDSFPPSIACPLSLRTSVLVEVRDGAGYPNASGATVRIVNPDAVGEAEGGPGGALWIPVLAENHPGPFHVEVEKPWHRPAVVSGVAGQSNVCGVTVPGTVSVTLERVADAPAVRQVVLPSVGWGFHQCGLSGSIVASLEADDSVSHELIWRSRDTTGVISVTHSALRVPGVSSPGPYPEEGPDSVSVAEVQVHCEQPTSVTTWVVAMAAADTAVRDSVRVSTF